MKKFLLMIIVLSAQNLFGQGTLFGLADLNLGILRPNYSAPGLARSYEIADLDSLHLNYQNFSAWSNISYTSFSLDAIVTAGFGKDKYGETYYRDHGGLQGGFIALPIVPKSIVFGVGIQPLISNEHTVKDTSIENSTGYVVLKGGISRVTANLSFRPGKLIGFGIGYEFNFGKIEDYYRLEFLGISSPLDFRYEYRFNGHGIVGSGFINLFDIITAGAMYRLPVHMNVEIYGETNASEANVKTNHSMTLPAQYNLGMMLHLSQRIKLGGDIIYQDWEKGFEVEGKNSIPSQNEYIRLGAGLEIKESEKRFTSFFNKMNYRFGAFYGSQKQTSLGNPVLEYGVSAGFSIPLRRFISRIDFTGIVGRRGDITQNYYEEDFYQIGISISTIERWFFNIEE